MAILNNKIKIHIKNNRWREGSFPNTAEGEKVFESSVFNWDGDDCLHIKVCGRDSVWTKDFECIDHGMQIGNPFLSALKGIKPTITSPLYSHLLTEK